MKRDNVIDMPKIKINNRDNGDVDRLGGLGGYHRVYIKTVRSFKPKNTKRRGGYHNGSVQVQTDLKTSVDALDAQKTNTLAVHFDTTKDDTMMNDTTTLDNPRYSNNQTHALVHANMNANTNVSSGPWGIQCDSGLEISEPHHKDNRKHSHMSSDKVNGKCDIERFDVPQHVGRRVKMARILHNLTQEELAQKIGKTVEEINVIENSRDIYSTKLLLELGEMLEHSFIF